MSETNSNAAPEKKGAGFKSILIIGAIITALVYFGHGYFTDLGKVSTSIDSLALAHKADSIAKLSVVDSSKSVVVGDTIKKVDAPVIDSAKVVAPKVVVKH